MMLTTDNYEAYGIYNFKFQNLLSLLNWHNDTAYNIGRPMHN